MFLLFWLASNSDHVIQIIKWVFRFRDILGHLTYNNKIISPYLSNIMVMLEHYNLVGSSSIGY
jgi:hypothetical protein